MPGVYIFSQKWWTGFKSLSTLRPLFRSIFLLFFEGFEIVINPPTPFQIYILLFSGCWNRYNLWWRGAAHFFARSLKWLLEPIFRERLVFFCSFWRLFLLWLCWKPKKHDSSTNSRCTGPPGPPVCGGNPGNRQQGVRDSIRHIWGPGRRQQGIWQTWVVSRIGCKE